MKTLIFYIVEPDFLKEFDVQLWVGDTAHGTPTAAMNTIDLFDEFHRDLRAVQNWETPVASSLIEASWAWFYPYLDQVKRWNLRRGVNLEQEIDRYFSRIRRTLHLLAEFEIEQLIFNEDPHRGFDYLLYQIAKFLGLPIYIISTINIRYRSFVKTEIHQGLEAAITIPIEAREKVPKDAQIQVSVSHAIPNGGALEQIPSPFFRGIRRISSLLSVGKWSRLVGASRRQYFVPRPSPLFSALVRNWIFSSSAYLKRLTYIRAYHSSAEQIRPDAADIVYFAHYFPERTTNPLGHPFPPDSKLALGILKSTGRRIFYKEHPNSLTRRNLHRNRTVHSKKLLQDLNQIGVRVVLEVDAGGAFILATNNGSGGLEAALQGQKVITFGSAWYDFLPNVHRYRDSAGLNKFLNLPETHPRAAVEVALRNCLNAHTLDARVESKYPTSSNNANALAKLILHVGSPASLGVSRDMGVPNE